MKLHIATALILGGALGALLVLVTQPRTSHVSASPSQTVAPIAAPPNRMPRLPAPPLTTAPAVSEPAQSETKPPQRITQLLKGDWPQKPTRAAIEPYVNENRRSAESLLAAFRASGDATFLEEAAAKYPDNPQVAYAALWQSRSADERRRWLDAFKRAAPENPLADYLSARDHFKAGERDLAVADIVAASGKNRWDDYARAFILSTEEAYRSAGYSEVEAKAVAGLGLPLPQLASLKEVSQHLSELAASYRAAGDEPSAQSALQMGVTLAQRISQAPNWLIQDLVGTASELILLKAADPTAPYDSAGQTVRERMDQLLVRREELKEIGRQSEALMQNLSERDLVGFLERWNAFGETAALRWLQQKHGAPSGRSDRSD